VFRNVEVEDELLAKSVSQLGEKGFYNYYGNAYFMVTPTIKVFNASAPVPSSLTK
jgi:hypothetical protein